MVFRLFLMVVLAAILGSSTPSQAAIPLYQNGPLTFTMGGFVELDTIFDSTRSFNEVIGSAPVSRPGTSNGDNGRMAMSVRNSRFYLQVDHHEEGGPNSKGYLEFDLLGYNPAPGANNTEGSLFANPSLRLRHGYLDIKEGGWDGLAGQTWQVFGWQPYYFMTTVNLLPLPAMVYSRTPQLRLTRTQDLSQNDKLQLAVSINRPAQRDNGLPDLQAGLRYSYGGWLGSMNGGSSGALAPQPLSIGVSGLFRDISVPDFTGLTSDLTHHPAAALSANVFVPILPSTKENQTNSLSVIASFTTGKGYGDQFSGWSGGTASPLNAAAASTGTRTYTLEQSRPFILDGGIGDYDSAGTFHLLQLTSYNFGAQYVLPFSEATTWIDAGHSYMSSNNTYLIATGTGGVGSAGIIPYSIEQSTYANIFHDFTPHLRMGAEYARIQTNYTDGVVAKNNRYQFSILFLF